MSCESDTRLFVGMLEYDTTDESLRNYFEQFGELTDYVVMKFPDSRRCKGFGFVTYREPEMLLNCLNSQPHKLNGKTVQLRRATPRDEDRKVGNCSEGTRIDKGFGPESNTRLFVGMLDYGTTDETLKYYFEQYGELTDYVIMKYPDTMRSKGFGFVTFRDPEMLEGCLRSQPHKLDGKTIQLKRATPKEEDRGDPGKGRDKDISFDTSSKLMRKLFIGAIDYQTTEEELRSHFEQFGELDDCTLMKFQDTGKSRGFGFVTYSRASHLDDCQAARPHVIGGKTLETKRATPRADIGKPEAQASVSKIFIGGINDEMNEEDLRKHFGQFGKVVNVEQMRWSDTGKKRGFGFIEFDDYDAVDKVVLINRHIVKKKRLEVKKALSKLEMSMIRKINKEDVLEGVGSSRGVRRDTYTTGENELCGGVATRMNTIGKRMNNMDNIGGRFRNEMGPGPGYMGGYMENDWEERFMGRSSENNGYYSTGMYGNIGECSTSRNTFGNAGCYGGSSMGGEREHMGERGSGPIRGNQNFRKITMPYSRPDRGGRARKF